MENNSIALEYNTSMSVEYLINEVIEKTINPQDKYEIAAILESIGWNDIRAEERFGVENIFELSTLIWDQLQENVKQEPLVHMEKAGFIEKIILIIKSFVRGLVFALPMVISVASMLTLRLSLWSYEYLSTELATSIAIGTILSFMSVGGFMQAIAVQGFNYLNQGFYNSAKKFTFFMLRKGYLLCFIVALIYTLFNVFYYNFTGEMLFIIIAYYLCLSSLWLSVTVMYILQRQFTFTFLITGGIGIVYLLFYIIGLNIIISQLIALIIVAVVGLILLIYFFNKEEDKNEKNISLSLPKMSILLYRLSPFFAYGFLYFTFLYIDRILAWSTDNFYMPYIIWFRGNYELGLDFALLTLVIPLGMSEVIVARFMKMLETSQKLSSLSDNNDAAQKYLNTYIRSMMLTAVVSVLSGVISYIAVLYVNTNPSTIFYTNYLHNAVTYFVFIMALISYSILALALTNAMMLLSLAQPRMVTKVMFWSLIINFIFGFILSRWFGYEFAVLGLMIGTVAFFIGTTYYVIKVLKNLDYYLYFTL